MTQGFATVPKGMYGGYLCSPGGIPPRGCAKRNEPRWLHSDMFRAAPVARSLRFAQGREADEASALHKLGFSDA
jgi:hypothetical protein